MDDYRQQLYSHPNVKRILELLGLISISWNEIELLWYLIYTCLIHEPHRDKIDAIFKQFDTSAKQRELIAAITGTLDEKSPFRKRIGQLIAQTQDLAGARNAFVHGNYIVSIVEGRLGLSISPGGGKKKPNKMAGHDVEQKMLDTVEKMHRLSDELDEFRLILVQEFLPKDKRIRPYSPEKLATMPPELVARLPRDLRERIAPPEFQTKDEE